MSITALGASAIGAAIAAAGAGAQGVASGKMNKRAERFNREEAEKTRNYNTDMWNRNNAYNTPEQQMKRYRDAGLNPYMMSYDNGNGSQASSSAQASAPNYSIPDYQGAFAQIGQNLMQGVKMQNEIENETKVANSTVEKNQASAALDTANANRIKELLPDEKQNFNSNWRNTDANRKKTEYETENMLPAELSNLNANTSNVNEIANLNKLLAFHQQLQNDVDEKYLSKQAQANLNKTMGECSLLLSQGRNYEAQAKLAIAMSNLTDKQREQLEAIMPDFISATNAENQFKTLFNSGGTGSLAWRLSDAQLKNIDSTTFKNNHPVWFVDDGSDFNLFNLLKVGTNQSLLRQMHRDKDGYSY